MLSELAAIATRDFNKIIFLHCTWMLTISLMIHILIWNLYQSVLKLKDYC